MGNLAHILRSLYLASFVLFACGQTETSPPPNNQAHVSGANETDHMLANSSASVNTTIEPAKSKVMPLRNRRDVIGDKKAFGSAFQYNDQIMRNLLQSHSSKPLSYARSDFFLNLLRPLDRRTTRYSNWDGHSVMHFGKRSAPFEELSIYYPNKPNSDSSESTILPPIIAENDLEDIEDLDLNKRNPYAWSEHNVMHFGKRSGENATNYEKGDNQNDESSSRDFNNQDMSYIWSNILNSDTDPLTDSIALEKKSANPWGDHNTMHFGKKSDTDPWHSMMSFGKRDSGVDPWHSMMSFGKKSANPWDSHNTMHFGKRYNDPWHNMMSFGKKSENPWNEHSTLHFGKRSDNEPWHNMMSFGKKSGDTMDDQGELLTEKRDASDPWHSMMSFGKKSENPWDNHNTLHFGKKDGEPWHSMMSFGKKSENPWSDHNTLHFGKRNDDPWHSMMSFGKRSENPWNDHSTLHFGKRDTNDPWHSMMSFGKKSGNPWDDHSTLHFGKRDDPWHSMMSFGKRSGNPWNDHSTMHFGKRNEDPWHSMLSFGKKSQSPWNDHNTMHFGKRSDTDPWHSMMSFGKKSQTPSNDVDKAGFEQSLGEIPANLQNDKNIPIQDLPKSQTVSEADLNFYNLKHNNKRSVEATDDPTKSSENKKSDMTYHDHNTMHFGKKADFWEDNSMLHFGKKSMWWNNPNKEYFDKKMDPWSSHNTMHFGKKSDSWDRHNTMHFGKRSNLWDTHNTMHFGKKSSPWDAHNTLHFGKKSSPWDAHNTLHFGKKSNPWDAHNTLHFGKKSDTAMRENGINQNFYGKDIKSESFGENQGDTLVLNKRSPTKIPQSSLSNKDQIIKLPSKLENHKPTDSSGAAKSEIMPGRLVKRSLKAVDLENQRNEGNVHITGDKVQNFKQNSPKLRTLNLQKIENSKNNKGLLTHTTSNKLLRMKKNIGIHINKRSAETIPEQLENNDGNNYEKISDLYEQEESDKQPSADILLHFGKRSAVHNENDDAADDIPWLTEDSIKLDKKSENPWDSHNTMHFGKRLDPWNSHNTMHFGKKSDLWDSHNTMHFGKKSDPWDLHNTMHFGKRSDPWDSHNTMHFGKRSDAWDLHNTMHFGKKSDPWDLHNTMHFGKKADPWDSHNTMHFGKRSDSWDLHNTMHFGKKSDPWDLHNTMHFGKKSDPWDLHNTMHFGKRSDPWDSHNTMHFGKRSDPWDSHNTMHFGKKSDPWGSHNTLHFGKREAPNLNELENDAKDLLSKEAQREKILGLIKLISELNYMENNYETKAASIQNLKNSLSSLTDGLSLHSNTDINAIPYYLSFLLEKDNWNENDFAESENENLAIEFLRKFRNLTGMKDSEIKDILSKLNSILLNEVNPVDAEKEKQEHPVPISDVSELSELSPDSIDKKREFLSRSHSLDVPENRFKMKETGKPVDKRYWSAFQGPKSIVYPHAWFASQIRRSVLPSSINSRVYEVRMAEKKEDPVNSFMHFGRR